MIRDDVTEFLKKNDFDIINMCETDFGSTREAEDFSIDGYKTHASKPNDRTGKVRLVVLIKNEVTKYCRIIGDDGSGYFPALFVDVKYHKSQPYILGGCYREWGAGSEKSIGEQLQRLNHLEDKIESLRRRYGGELWIGGDFNLNAQRFDDGTWDLKKVADRLMEICEKHSLKRLDAGPTYNYTKNEVVKSSTLDYFL